MPFHFTEAGRVRGEKANFSDFALLRTEKVPSSPIPFACGLVRSTGVSAWPIEGCFSWQLWTGITPV